MKYPPEGCIIKYMSYTPKEKDKSRSAQSQLASMVRFFALLSHKGPLVEEISRKVGPFIEISANKFWVRLLEKTLGSEYLIWACQHLLPPDTKFHWIGDFEHASALCAYGDARLYRKYIGKCISSKKCIAMLAWTNKAKDNLENIMDCKNDDKIRVIYPAVAAIDNISVEKSDGRINLIHVGTWRNTGIENQANFLVKGTRDTLLVSKMLLEKFKSRIKITVRAFVPPHIERQFKSKFGDGIEFVRTPLPRKKIIEAFQKSDIFMLPCHSTPTMAFIEAMSCGLSIVTTDVWANRELLGNGKFATIVEPPRHVKYEDEFGTPMWYRAGFMNELEKIDTRFIHDLFESVSSLIEDENLLNQTKKEALLYYKNHYTVDNRNAQLKDIFRTLTVS